MRTLPPPLGYAGLLKLSSLPECRTERIEGILFLLLLLPEIAEYRFLDFRAAMMGVDTSTTVVDKRLVEVSRVSGSGSAVRGIDAVFASRTSAEGVQRRAIQIGRAHV